MDKRLFEKHLEKKRKNDRAKIMAKKEPGNLAERTSFGESRSSGFGREKYFKLDVDTKDEYKAAERKLIEEKRRGAITDKELAEKIMKLQEKRRAAIKAQKGL